MYHTHVNALSGTRAVVGTNGLGARASVFPCVRLLVRRPRQSSRGGSGSEVRDTRRGVRFRCVGRKNFLYTYACRVPCDHCNHRGLYKPLFLSYYYLLLLLLYYASRVLTIK